MSKIYLHSDRIEHKIYYIDRETKQFYISNYMSSYALGQGKDWTNYFLGFLIVFGFVITALHDRVDHFYIPLSSTASNAILLVVLVIMSIIFYLRTKKKFLNMPERSTQPVSLKNEMEQYLFKKLIGTSILFIGLLVVALCGAMIAGIFFMNTSGSRMYVLAGLLLFIFAGLAPRTRTVLVDMKFIAEQLKRYKD